MKDLFYTSLKRTLHLLRRAGVEDVGRGVDEFIAISIVAIACQLRRLCRRVAKFCVKHLPNSLQRVQECLMGLKVSPWEEASH